MAHDITQTPCVTNSVAYLDQWRALQPCCHDNDGVIFTCREKCALMVANSEMISWRQTAGHALLLI